MLIWPDDGSESCPKVATVVSTSIVRHFKIGLKVIIYLGYFCKKNCYYDLSKIAQSGHT